MKKNQSSKLYFLTLCSALLYAASFVWIEHCWFCGVFFLIPVYRLMLTITDIHSAYKLGFLWGLVTYSFQTIALVDFVFQRSISVIGLLVPCCMIMFMSSAAALWFLSMYIMIKRYALYQHMLIIGCSVLFFFCMHTSIFVIVLGVSYGYPFSFPLIPLFNGSVFVQQLLVYCGSWLLLTVIISLQYLIAVYEIRIIVLLFMVGIVDRFFFTDTLQQEELSLYCVVEVPQVLPSGSKERALALCESVTQAQYEHPQAIVFIVPESAFPFYEDREHQFLARLLANYMPVDTYCIVGVYRKEDGKRYNSALCIKNGKILYIYDKKLLVPFFEHIPPVWGDLIFSINGVNFFKGSAEQTVIWDLGALGKVQIAICAELFWSPLLYNIPLIGLVNDSYFRYRYFPKLMNTYGKYKATELKCDLFYSGYEK